MSSLLSVGPQFPNILYEVQDCYLWYLKNATFVNDFDMMNCLMIVEIGKKKNRALHYEVE